MYIADIYIFAYFINENNIYIKKKKRKVKKNKNFLQGTVDRLIGRALLAVDYISDSFTKEQILPLISVLATLMLIGVAGYGMSYLAYV